MLDNINTHYAAGCPALSGTYYSSPWVLPALHSCFGLACANNGERKFALLNETIYVYAYSLEQQKAASSISIA